MSGNNEPLSQSDESSDIFDEDSDVYDEEADDPEINTFLGERSQSTLIRQIISSDNQPNSGESNSEGAEELEGDIDIGGDNVSSDWSDEPFVEEGTINLSKEDHENVKNVDNSTFGSISLSKESNTCSDDIDFSKNETQGISLEKEDKSNEGGISLEKEDDSSKGGISLDKDTSTPGISLEKDENKSSGISLSKEEDTSEKKEISLEKKEEQLEKGRMFIVFSIFFVNNSFLEEVKKEKAEISNASLRRSQNPAKPLLGESIDRSSSLRERLRAKKTNKKDFVPINLETMSAIAVADIKRFSLSSTAIVDIEGIISGL